MGEIEDGIPVPPPQHGKKRGIKDRAREMTSGQSRHFDLYSEAHSFKCCFYQLGAKAQIRKRNMREHGEDGWRVWKV